MTHSSTGEHLHLTKVTELRGQSQRLRHFGSSRVRARRFGGNGPPRRLDGRRDFGNAADLLLEWHRPSIHLRASRGRSSKPPDENSIDVMLAVGARTSCAATRGSTPPILVTGDGVSSRS